VHRSRRELRFVLLRRHAVARLFAFAFIALILLPFTAPFPTYQLDAAHGHPYDALPKEFKNKLGSAETLILPSDCRLSLPALSDVFVGPFLCSNQVTDHLLHHTVLRL
jgi:hypothetical protein